MSLVSGHVALILECNEGICRESALKLAKAGCHISLFDENGLLSVDLAVQIRQLGVKCVVSKGKCSSDKDLEYAVKKTIMEYGIIDIVVMNMRLYSFDLDKLLQQDAFQLEYTVQLCLPELKKASQTRQKSFVVIGSIEAHSSSEIEFVAHHTSRCVRNTLALRYFETMREFGIRVSLIRTGFVNSYPYDIPGLDRNKFIDAADVAETVVFVATFPSSTCCPNDITIRPQRSVYAEDDSARQHVNPTTSMSFTAEQLATTSSAGQLHVIGSSEEQQQPH